MDLACTCQLYIQQKPTTFTKDVQMSPPFNCMIMSAHTRELLQVFIDKYMDDLFMNLRIYGKNIFPIFD
jgi:hypothetical protein